MLRIALATAAAVFATLMLAGWSHAATATRGYLKTVSAANLGDGSGRVRDGLVTARARAFAAAQLTGWGGAYTTPSGESVNVFSSNAYPVDPAANQAIANFLASLVHGKELPKVTVYMAPAVEVGSLCHSEEADGCYFPASGQLISIGEDSQWSTVEEVLTHEYGHHVATNRTNAPWNASAWGTKRWATEENVCRRTAMGMSFPGDEGDHYLSNPGEAFAESFLHLNEVRNGQPETRWFYDPYFAPTPASLKAIELDVLKPWNGWSVYTWKGRFSRRGELRMATLRTPLDGVFELRLKAPRGSRIKILAKETKQISPTVAQGLICGDRTFTTQVAAGGAGAFTARALVP